MKRYMIGFIVILIAFIGCQIPYILWESNSELVRYPPPDIVMTAEYLYANPPPTPTNHAFQPAPSTMISKANMREYSRNLCVSGEVYIVWIINGKNPPRVMYDELAGIFPILDNTPDWTKEFNCFEYPNLLPVGTHLIEVRFGRVTPNLFGESFLPVASYQWAFKVVPNAPSPTPTP
jgi:hypothetical protein